MSKYLMTALHQSCGPGLITRYVAQMPVVSQGFSFSGSQFLHSGVLAACFKRSRSALLTAQTQQLQPQLQTLSRPVTYCIISMCITAALINVFGSSCALAFISGLAYCTELYTLQIQHTFCKCTRTSLAERLVMQQLVLTQQLVICAQVPLMQHLKQLLIDLHGSS